MGRIAAIVCVLATILGGIFGYLAGRSGYSIVDRASAADTCQTFQETGKTVCGVFLLYWREHGGLAQQGLPLSGELNEQNVVDGKTYRVQYFERAVFEYHPENQPPYDVLLSLLGSAQYQAKYGGPATTPPAIIGQTVNVNNRTCCDPLLMRVQVIDLKDNVTIVRDGRTFTPNGKYVAVVMRVTNLGKAPGPVGFGGFILVDQHNRQFASSPYGVTPAAAAMYKLHQYDNYIEPGLSDDQVLIFDVQPDASDFRLVVATNYQPK